LRSVPQTLSEEEVMRSTGLIGIAFILILVLAIVAPIAAVFTDSGGGGKVQSYMAVVPKVLHAGGQEAISLALFDESGLTSDWVEVALLKDGDQVLQVSKQISGKGTIDFKVPFVAEGAYEIRVKGSGFEDKAQVTIQRSSLIFLETDKPIYKPGQTIQMRAITLDSDLKPVSGGVTVEVLDAKGIKIFRSETNTDEYGMATLELPISQEPNLGTWKITAKSDKDDTQIDVRVEEYVLPKYEVKVELPKDWFLVDEPIKGSVSAEYSFGKPVKGELVITAKRYVGQWEQYATLSKSIDGNTDFELPAVGYVAGVPAAGGLGNVMLDITVKESATGYEESTSELLTVSSTPLNIQIIPESSVFKPGLPFNILIITETPDNQAVDAKVDVTVTYLNKKLEELSKDNRDVDTNGGKALIELNPPADSVAMAIEAFELTPVSSTQPAQASKMVEAGYSPSGNFIHVEQISQGIPQIGELISFKVHSTKEAANFYYEVVARDRVVFTDFTQSDVISFDTTPLMTPSGKLLVYQILPNSEVAADYIPFDVEAVYPNDVKVEFNQSEARPGDEVRINIDSQGQSEVGLTAVDKSVFILAGNRLNLQQVFDELEKLYMKPQAELHEVSIYEGIDVKGAKDIFDDAGVVVLSNNNVPEGKEYKLDWGPRVWNGAWKFMGQGPGGGVVVFAGAEDGAVPPMPTPGTGFDTGVLAEVQRVRQYFPETWLWQNVITGPDGKASVHVVVPDTITTWMLRAVALSKENGLGIAEDQLTAFQPFFLSADLPYSAIRGEEFPVKVAIYNYLDQPQSVLVQIDNADWFDLLDESQETVEIAPNEVGGVEFNIKPTNLGVGELKITARSKQAADAVIKTLIVEPEGVARENVQNLVLSAGNNTVVDTSIPAIIVDGSGRAYIAVTSSYLTQTIDGLDALIQMPFGCGEQNMILFAPDVYITKYLKESGQLKPEIMAKAEKLMITGYQRELTYQRSDGSFSAFGDNDEQGSLFLTAFVLKCFSQAKDLIYIDDSVLSQAEKWITDHQNADGSFDSVGFVAHQDMMGGLKGKTALTAYVAIALLEAGDTADSAKAIGYLEGQLDNIDDAYTMAITAYALELARSPLTGQAHDKLMGMAQEDENGLHWGDVAEVEPQPLNQMDGGMMPFRPMEMNRSNAIEATGYATLALIKNGDAFDASRAAKWLVSQRNAYGGYGSTQDTVVALQALIEYCTNARADVDLTVTINAGGEVKQLSIKQNNFDVLQIVEVSVNQEITISTEGRGDAIAQVVERYNLPQAEKGDEILKINVNYDTTQVEVNDLVKVSVGLEYNPPIEMNAEMVVLDVSVPTGFSPVAKSIDKVIAANDNIKRYEIAGRKVIFYIEDMQPGDKVSFSFDVRALYPVTAKGVSSQAYSYYNPDIKAETLSQGIVVTE
jgi:CD109 antigen